MICTLLPPPQATALHTSSSRRLRSSCKGKSTTELCRWSRACLASCGKGCSEDCAHVRHAALRVGKRQGCGEEAVRLCHRQPPAMQRSLCWYFLWVPIFQGDVNPYSPAITTISAYLPPAVAVLPGSLCRQRCRCCGIAGRICFGLVPLRIPGFDLIAIRDREARRTHLLEAPVEGVTGGVAGFSRRQGAGGETATNRKRCCARTSRRPSRSLVVRHDEAAFGVNR